MRWKQKGMNVMKWMKYQNLKVFNGGCRGSVKQRTIQFFQSWHFVTDDFQLMRGDEEEKCK
ncbi:hypothetical protein Hanom_Chr03g00238591 [Helianthus anomalus]